MGTRAIYDDELHAHFVTFSCYRRRRLLDDDRAKRVVLGVLNAQLASRKASCVGFVVMPDHVHAVVWFPVPGQLSVFMQQWKRLSSHQIRRLLRSKFVHYAENPVRAGLVARPCDWVFSSACYYEQGQSVGVPIRWIP